MKKSINLKELKKILEEMPKRKIEEERGDHYEYVYLVDPDSIIFYVEKYLENPYGKIAKEAVKSLPHKFYIPDSVKKLTRF